MNQKIKKRLIRFVILSALGLLIGGGVAWYQIQLQTARVMPQGSYESQGAIEVAGLKIGGPFTLTDHTGKQVNQDSWPGQYQLIYFGFTYCPAICPTELQKMTRAMSALGERAQKIQPILISVDPERDTPEVLADYVDLFHPRLVGLTGTVPQINAVKRSYRIFASKVQDEDLSDYTMDHSTFTYLFDPEGNLISMYRIEDTADFMAADLRAKIPPLTAASANPQG
jgi:protein SCO1/2